MTTIKIDQDIQINGCEDCPFSYTLDINYEAMEYSFHCGLTGEWLGDNYIDPPSYRHKKCPIKEVSND